MKSILAAILGVLTLVSASCAPLATPPPTYTPAGGKGTLEVRVTDAPRTDNVTSILVTASRLEVHRAAADQERERERNSDNLTSTDNQTERERERNSNRNSTDNQTQEPRGGWLTLTLAMKSFDLLKIKGIEEIFATSEVAAGKYTQLRLVIDKVEVGLGGEAPKPATLPSGELKFVHPFDVVAGQKTVILLDF
ncbi:MAG: DUF4382 domain-containing protein, partial [Chloroflexota bacterium]